MMPYMTGAKVSIFNLKNYSKGLEYLNKHECVKKVKIYLDNFFVENYFWSRNICFQHPRYHEYLAECYSLQSVNSRSMAEKRNLNMKALENFRLVSRVSTRFAFFILLRSTSQDGSLLKQKSVSLVLRSREVHHLLKPPRQQIQYLRYFNQTKSKNSMITADVESIFASWIPHRQSEWATRSVIEPRSYTEDFSLKFSN